MRASLDQVGRTFLWGPLGTATTNPSSTTRDERSALSRLFYRPTQFDTPNRSARGARKLHLDGDTSQDIFNLTITMEVSQ